MDSVYEYKKNWCNYIKTLDDSIKISITLEQLFYILLSEKPQSDKNLLEITKKMFKAFKNNKASSNISGLKKLINYTEISGLDEDINNEIYELLVVDQLINKNNQLLKEEFDPNLNEMNYNLITNYNIRKQNFINDLLQLKEQ